MTFVRPFRTPRKIGTGPHGPLHRQGSWPWIHGGHAALRRVGLVALITFSGGATAVSAQDDAIPVSVVTAALQDMSQQVQFSGRIEAINSVALIAKVQGYLETKHFEEGAEVAAGTLLFELEDDVYANALAQAQAALASARAQETLAGQTFQRQDALSERSFASQQARDEAQANLAVATAQVGLAQTQVDAAQLDLDYTRISAPLSGRIGRAAVSIGDLISPQSGAMATVVQTDPIYATFPIPQTVLMDIQNSQHDIEDVTIRLFLADGSVYPMNGTFKYVGVQATASTDSVLVRATVPNPDGVLLDRQLVNVELVSDRENMVLTVPQQALLVDQQGAYVMVVDDKDEVQRVNIEIGTQRDNLLVVTSGLDEGAQVITEGLQKVQPGAKVRATAAETQQ